MTNTKEINTMAEAELDENELEDVNGGLLCEAIVATAIVGAAAVGAAAAIGTAAVGAAVGTAAVVGAGALAVGAAINHPVSVTYVTPHTYYNYTRW